MRYGRCDGGIGHCPPREGGGVGVTLARRLWSARRGGSRSLANPANRRTPQLGRPRRLFGSAGTPLWREPQRGYHQVLQQQVIPTPLPPGGELPSPGNCPLASIPADLPRTVDLSHKKIFKKDFLVKKGSIGVNSERLFRLLGSNLVKKCFPGFFLSLGVESVDFFPPLTRPGNCLLNCVPADVSS